MCTMRDIFVGEKDEVSVVMKFPENMVSNNYLQISARKGYRRAFNGQAYCSLGIQKRFL